MAEVYLGKLVGAGGFEKPVAIKRLLPSLAADPQTSEAFLQEARLCVHLVHPNVVQVLDLGTTGGTPFLVMELVDGEDLRRILNVASAAGDPLEPAEAIHVAACVAEALAHADEAIGPTGEPLHVVHRDVNPSNVMISMTGEVKLADFGVARAADGRQATEGNLLKGKLGYLAPELLQGAQAMHASDIFLAGVLLWEMLACRPLFAGSGPGQTLAQISQHDESTLEMPEGAPEALHPILRRALARDPADRYEHARELAADLREVLTAQGWRVGRRELAARMARLFPERPRLDHDPGMGVTLVDDRSGPARRKPRPAAEEFGVAPRGRRRRLGEMLVEAQAITAGQLQTLLSRQREGGGRLGEWVVRLGYAAPRTVLQVLARQLGVPFITDEKLLESAPSDEILGAFPRSLAERLLALPVTERDGVVWVATTDPGNLDQLDTVRFRLGRSIRPIVCTESGLRRAIDFVYSTRSPDAVDLVAAGTQMIDFDDPRLHQPAEPPQVQPIGQPAALPSGWPTASAPLWTGAATTPPAGQQANPLVAWVPAGVGPDGQPLYVPVPVSQPVVPPAGLPAFPQHQATPPAPQAQAMRAQPRRPEPIQEFDLGEIDPGDIPELDEVDP